MFDNSATYNAQEELSFLNRFKTHESLHHLIKQILVFSSNSMLITNAGRGSKGYRIIYANPAFRHATGYSLEELVGESPAILQGEKSNKHAIERLRPTLEKQGFYHAASINYKKDGSWYPVEWNISAIKDKSGQDLYYISMQKDLTNLYNLADKFKDTNEELKSVVQDLMPANKLSSIRQPKLEKAVKILKQNASLYQGAGREDDASDLFDDAFFDFNVEEKGKGALADNNPREPISAREYMTDCGLDQEDINSILDALEGINNEVEILKNDPSQLKRIYSVSTYIDELSDYLFFLMDFANVAVVLNEVAESIAKCTNLNTDEFPIDALFELSEDLKSWLTQVFIENSAENIFDGEVMVVSGARQLITFIEMNQEMEQTAEQAC